MALDDVVARITTNANIPRYPRPSADEVAAATASFGGAVALMNAWQGTYTIAAQETLVIIGGRRAIAELFYQMNCNLAVPAQHYHLCYRSDKIESRILGKQVERIAMNAAGAVGLESVP
jgi:hypothetical protein